MKRRLVSTFSLHAHTLAYERAVWLSSTPSTSFIPPLALSFGSHLDLHLGVGRVRLAFSLECARSAPSEPGPRARAPLYVRPVTCDANSVLVLHLVACAGSSSGDARASSLFCGLSLSLWFATRVGVSRAL